MSDDEPVTRREHEAFKELARERQEGNVREFGRVDRSLDLLDRQHEADVRAVREEHAADMARLATQREQDLNAQRQQREQDLATARNSAQHTKEWSWQMKLAVFSLAIALVALYVQTVARR